MAESSETAPDRAVAIKVGLLCAAMIVVHAALAWFAVQGKCATMDEPLHAASAYLTRFNSEYRVDPEDPPLWKFWAMLPVRRDDLYIEKSGWDWAVGTPRVQSLWAQYAVLQTLGVDGPAFMARTRAMFLACDVLLGISIALTAYKLCGPVAACVATTLFALDPTFLGHGALVKNDVSITLVLLLFMAAVYRAGVRLTITNALLVCVLLGVGMNVKYSAVLLVPMLIAALAVRVAIPRTWHVMRWNLARKGQRAIAGAGLFFLSIVVAWLMIWMCYRFRFAAGPGGELIDNAGILQVVADNRYFLHAHQWAKGNEQAGYEQCATVRIALWAQRCHLLPQAWIAGFLVTYATSLVRPAFLLGQFYEVGRWYYFPLAWLFKAPVATIAATLATGAWIVARAARRRLIQADTAWRALCLAIPIVIYGVSAMASNLNIGVRHILPVMPFLFILIGAAATALRRAAPRAFVAVWLSLVVGLAAETFAAFPNFIAFFNVAAGGSRGGLTLLADSNLDWGQDLPAVAVWQDKHPDEPLYLIYFGRGGREAYGLKLLAFPDRPCTLALSATALQGVYLDPGRKDTFRPLWRIPPREVLNGTIYLYRFPQDMPNSQLADEIRQLVRDAQAAG